MKINKTQMIYYYIIYYLKFFISINFELTLLGYNKKNQKFK